MPKVLALAVSGGLLLLAPVTRLEIFPGARASIEEKVPSEFLPFSLSQVLGYFNEAFGRQPFRLDERTFVYTDRTNPDETVIITVSQLDTGLAVVLLTTGDYGLNYLREFFEAPFFLRSETEQFYTFLSRGPGVHSITLDRFTFRLSLSQTGNWLVAALEFGPAQIYRPELATARSAGHGGAPQFSTSKSQKPARPKEPPPLPFHNLQIEPTL
jgi:hypothetical protein